MKTIAMLHFLMIPSLFISISYSSWRIHFSFLLFSSTKKKKKKDPNFLSIVQPSNPFEFSPLIDQQSKKFIEERRAREEGREQHMPDRQWDRLVIRRRDEQQSSPLGPVNRDKRVHPDPIDLSQVPSGMGAD